ncbi:uncharacterized protein LOC130740317 isoform X2 [Lotus japonicus]|uniref:uncharacterized protein LOC130740317 isoform X2 n=1 Tax=Lotus japonicus TaxID=34305 RepID=UPI00258D43C1|nr:uncharacterized protein LOC130740317 isoform X2 [Lotus japonicus]
MVDVYQKPCQVISFLEEVLCACFQVTDGEGEHAAHVAGYGKSINEGALTNLVKRKLKVSGSEFYEDADSKLRKVETKVVEKVEITGHDFANADDGLLGEINRLKEIKIADGGSDCEGRFVPVAEFKVQEKHEISTCWLLEVHYWMVDIAYSE